MKYICMNCGKIFEDKCLPIIKEGDGCCTVGSLIELDKRIAMKNSGQILRHLYNV